MGVTKICDEFIGINSKNITLRFGLKPVGATTENLDKYWEQLKDEQRNEAYPIVKEVLDREYQNFISEVLQSIEKQEVLDWTKLTEYISMADSKTGKEKVQKEQLRLRKAIVKELGKHPAKKGLTGKKAFGKNGYLVTKKLTQEEKEAVGVFDGFTTYFENYNQNRENYFSTEEKSTAVAYRIVNENFPKHLLNVQILNKIKEFAPDLIDIVSAKAEQGADWTGIFEIQGYNSALSQKGIDVYNEVVGIYNREANLYKQKHEKNLPEGHPLRKRKTSQLVMLFKQIGSDKDDVIHIDKFETDEEVFAIWKILKDKIDEANIFEKLAVLKEEMQNWDYDKIYLSAQKLSEISIYLSKMQQKNLEEGKKEEEVGQNEIPQWNYINNALETHWRSEMGAKVTGAKLEEALAKCKKSYYSVRFLQDAIDESVVDDERKLDVKQWISSFEDYQNDIEEKEKELNKFLSDIAETSLKETDISPIKDYLDLWIQVSRFCKSFYAEGVEKEILDEAFYQILQELLSVFDEIIYFYNKLRNYVTQKPYSLDKMRIKFGNPTLANGWHKEKDDGSTILRKDGKYYLAVTNPINKKMVIPASTKHCTEEEYEKMVYKQFPDVKKMIPKCTMVNEVKSFFADKNAGDTYVLKKAEYQGNFVITREEYDLSCAEEEGYKKWQKDYLRITQDEEGYQDAVKKWNCFCMRFLKTYKSTADYDYSSLMKPEEYESVDLFYHDLDKILYKIRFEYVSSKEIDELVKEGRIFLFQIYNKDFSEYRRPESKKNLHTLYWEALFSEENQKANVIKLNGGAELFKRKASIKNKVIHKAGEVLVNKRTIDGEPIPDDIYMDLCAYYNGKEKVSSDSDDTYKQYIDKVYTSTKKYDIVKDKRFMKDQQGSFNVIQKMDYQKKLQQKEQNRDKERKTWKNIETIKELKEGYISQVVHELADMAIKNNAIIVMEDLNFGFKRGRTKVERQVYQKFEMALINKLQYLVMDKTEGEAMLNPGGVLQGYQLAVQPKSLKDVGKQCGFVFYVPPGYTSKIDPTTGFADVFNMSNITNRSSRKAFFEKFDNIFYDKSRNMFGFSFNYENFITYQTFYKKDWTVYSNGSRYMWNRNTKTESCVDVTEKLKALFSENQINYEQDNLYQQIMDVECDVKHAEFWSELFWYFRVMLRLRNSSNEHEIDQIISPVLNKLGEFFQTPEEVTEDSCMSDLPMDADTNGAYHIALKGLLLLQERFNDDTVDLEKSLPKDFYKITNAQWFEYMQKEK